jgi:dihydrofolate reductase
MLSIIAAIANRNVLGKDNKLIWHLPEDLKRFKSITSGKTIIMGRKTFESLGRVLPNRKHIILSHDTNFTYDDENVQIVNDVEALKDYIESGEEHFVIGGATIYKLLIPYTSKMYITKIDYDFEGDTYFPEIKETEWTMVEQEKGLKDDNNPYDYRYITYLRR